MAGAEQSRVGSGSRGAGESGVSGKEDALEDPGAEATLSAAADDLEQTRARCTSAPAWTARAGFLPICLANKIVTLLGKDN